MEPKIYFDRESPDFNIGLYGKPERTAANRVILCIITEYGLCNDRRMHAHQVKTLIASLQTTTGSFKDYKARIKLKKHVKQIHVAKPIQTTTLIPLSEQASNVECPTTMES